MPTYGYCCTKCAHKFDSFHSMKSTEPQHCPVCDGIGKKLMSASSIIFKGSGFYTTDYRDSGYVEAKKQEKSPSASSPSTTKDDKPSTPTKPSEPSSGSSSGSKSSTNSSSGTSTPGSSPPTKSASSREMATAA